MPRARSCRRFYTMARKTMSWTNVSLCRGWFRQQHTNVSPDQHQTSVEAASHHVSSLVLKEPECDLDFLLNPDNLTLIKENITNRKGIGDIELVHRLWRDYQSENDPAQKSNLHRQLLAAALDIPNMSHPGAPIGEEDCAKQVDLLGSKREYSFTPKTMVQLGEGLRMLRTDNVSMVTGSRTYFLVDKLALLEHALVQFTLAHLVSKGFQLISVPDLLDPQIVERCGFRTTGDITQVYKLDPQSHGDICLAGTSEMALAGYFLNEVLDPHELPAKVAAVSRCYRAETSDLDDRDGIYRVHQFTKVEMFGVTRSEDDHGNSLLMDIIDLEKLMYSQLGLHCRVLEMPTSELGAPASRKFDIEAWMPGRRGWGEISSASNCTDYQSRRLNIKYRTSDGGLKHCTTVNGTACAVPRMIMALCETHQQKDGSIALPEALREYMEGETRLTKSRNLPFMKFIKHPNKFMSKN